jgi:DNA-binding SARP family transcriptional activator
MNQTRQYVTGLLSVKVLGPLQVMVGDEQITLGTPRQQAVFLPLVLRPGGPVAPEAILDGVWGEAIPASSIGLVRTYISRLRLILGRDMIGRHTAGYYVRLHPDQIDLTAFDQQVLEARELRRRDQLGLSAAAWRGALKLWRGPPLSGLPGPFAESQRQWLTDLHLTALEQCWDTEIRLGRQAELIAELSAAMRDHPLRENLTRLLMLASYWSGRQADAIAAFEQTRRRLAEELGVQPTSNLQRLHDRIRTGDL